MNFTIKIEVINKAGLESMYYLYTLKGLERFIVPGMLIIIRTLMVVNRKHNNFIVTKTP